MQYKLYREQCTFCNHTIDLEQIGNSGSFWCSVFPSSIDTSRAQQLTQQAICTVVFVTAGSASAHACAVWGGRGSIPSGCRNYSPKKLAGFHGAERYMASLKIEQHEQGLRPGGKKVSGHCGNSTVEGCPKKLEKEPTKPAAGTAGTEKFSRYHITT